MPTKSVYVKPRVLLRYKGITVYHTYECGELDSENRYHFTTAIEQADADDLATQFDVRNLKTWVEPPHPPFLIGKDDTPANKRAWNKYHDSNVRDVAIKDAIRNAINLGGEVALYAAS